MTERLPTEIAAVITTITSAISSIAYVSASHAGNGQELRLVLLLMFFILLNGWNCLHGVLD